MPFTDCWPQSRSIGKTDAQNKRQNRKKKHIWLWWTTRAEICQTCSILNFPLFAFHFPSSILHFSFSNLHSPFSIIYSPFSFSILHFPFFCFHFFPFSLFHFSFSSQPTAYFCHKSGRDYHAREYLIVSDLLLFLLIGLLIDWSKFNFDSSHRPSSFPQPEYYPGLLIVTLLPVMLGSDVH